MLDLSRREGEELTITNTRTGEVIRVQYVRNVMSRDGHPTMSIHLGIDAPRHYSIERPDMKNRLPKSDVQEIGTGLRMGDVP